MKHKFLLLYSWLIRSLLFFFPDIPFVMRFRGFLYGLGMKSCGKDFQVPHDVIIRELENISVMDHIFIGNHTIMMGSGEIQIKNKALIGPHCILVSGDHSFNGKSYSKTTYLPGCIVIGDGAWVAGNCTITKNSELPACSVLGASSLLNKKFDTPYSLYGGVPAKHIKNL